MNSCGNSRSPFRVCRHPFLQHDALDAPHRFFLGNAGVGDAVEMAIEQRLLVLRGQVAVVRHALVVVVRHQVEHVFFEIGAGAADAVDLAGADHLGQRDAEFGGAHRPCERHQHLAAGLQMLVVRLRRVDQRRGVEVQKVAIDEGGNRAGRSAHVVFLGDAG